MAADRKAEIRNKAAEVFAEKGFHRASIRDVAKASNMSLAGLYYYYRGKDEILFDIQHEAFGHLLESHAEALAGVKDPEEKLQRVIEAHLEFFASNIPQMKVISHESEALEDKFGEMVGEQRRRYVRLVRGILDEIGAQHPLRDVPTSVAVFFLFGMMNWVYTWYDEKRDGTAADLARAVRTIFLRGILASDSGAAP
jgi:AcrR family transcriptional regulator